MKLPDGRFYIRDIDALPNDEPCGCSAKDEAKARIRKKLDEMNRDKPAPEATRLPTGADGRLDASTLFHKRMCGEK